MKRNLILLILFSFLPALHAQEDFDYRPFIEEGKEWTSILYLGYRPWSGLNILQDYFEKDTIVADIPCKCWRQRYYNPKKGTTNTFTVSVYEDDRKLWIFHDGEVIPRLTYDFKADIGDTLVISSADAQIYNYFKDTPGFGIDYFNRYYQDTILVVGKESVELDGWKLEQIRFSSKYFDFKGPNEYYYLRLGSLIRPSYNNSARESSQVRGLLHCMVGDELIYYSQATIDFWQETAESIGIKLPTTISTPKMVNGKWSNVKFFDLSGRRLTAPPAKGMYIENGRKRVVK